MQEYFSGTYLKDDKDSSNKLIVDSKYSLLNSMKLKISAGIFTLEKVGFLLDGSEKFPSVNNSLYE